MVVEVPLSAAGFPKPSDDDITDMTKLLSDGKRNFVCGQYSVALECFVDLCERLSHFYGQESEKCVEAYLYYGKSLLEMGRLENGVLGHAVSEAPVFGVDEEVTTGESTDDIIEDNENLSPGKREKLRDDVEEAMRGDNLYNKSMGDDTEESETEEDMETGDGAKTESTNVEGQAMDDTVAKPQSDDKELKGGDDSDIENDEEDDISNMELSWQMFELTVLICNRQLKESKDNKEVKLNLAEAKYGLAQISQETEQYEEAVKDFTECLNLYKDILEDKNDRRLAESHYNIAISLSFDKKYTEAIEHFQAAVTILKARIAILEEKIKEAESTGGKEKASAELEAWQKEVIELNDLILLDLTAKIEDANESKKLLDESIKNVKNVAAELFSSFGGTKNNFDGGFETGFDTPGHTEVVNDISSKIRSAKRKSDDETTGPDKKMKALNVDVAKETASSEE